MKSRSEIKNHIMKKIILDYCNCCSPKNKYYNNNIYSYSHKYEKIKIC